jgi:tRNA-dihydrouridine synthase B
MIGRRALEHPFVFREARARLDHAPKVAAPSFSERAALCREHLLLLEAEHGPVRALRAMGQWFPRYLGRLPGSTEWLRELRGSPRLDAVLETLDSLAEQAREQPSVEHLPGGNRRGHEERV